MSLKWPNKDPDETLDYSVDWSRFLGEATVVSVTWYVEDSDGTKTLLTPGGSVVNNIQLIAATNTRIFNLLRQLIQALWLQQI